MLNDMQCCWLVCCHRSSSRLSIMFDNDEISFSLVETQPNTPPCFWIMEIAASWFLGSVAAQQSVNKRHSYPMSLAVRIVVWTQTSVVTPAKMIFRMPFVLRIRSKFVATKLPFPGLLMTISSGRGAHSGIISHPGSPTTSIRPHGPLLPISAPICLDLQEKSLRCCREPDR